MKRSKCSAICPEYIGAVRLPDSTVYCQRLVGHSGPHRAATKEWDQGSKNARTRAEIERQWALDRQGR